MESQSAGGQLEARAGTHRLLLRRGDLTAERTDALVTAANAALAGGGGVDGAIHRAAGPGLLRACRALGGCSPGDAVATEAFDLAARGVQRVIHAVGPIYGAHGGAEDALLAAAHRRSLEVAAAEGCRSLAFPAISCGVYGFPVPRAARLALAAILSAWEGDPALAELGEVRYVLFGAQDYETFAEALRELAAAGRCVLA